MKWIEHLRRHPWKVGVALLLVAIGVWIYITQRQHLSREELVKYGESLPAVWFLISFATLPMVGFPFSLMLFLAGVRFGFWGGMAVSSGGIIIHSVLAYRIIHGWFREPLTRWLDRSGYKIPEPKGGNQVWFTALFAAVHGPPYIAKLYLLALTNVRLRLHLIVGAPIYIFFAAVPVGAGSAAFRVRPIWLYLFFAAMLALAWFTHWLGKRYSDKV